MSLTLGIGAQIDPMVTTTMTADMWKPIMTFSTFMNNRFDEINVKFDKLNARLDNIERARPKVDAENDIPKVLDNWKKKFDEFFARRENSPPIVDPPQPELTTPEIAYKGGAPSTTTPSSQLPQPIADPKLPSGEICAAPTSTSTMATATFGYINNLWYASYHLTGGAQQWYMRLT